MLSLYQKGTFYSIPFKKLNKIGIALPLEHFETGFDVAADLSSPSFRQVEGETYLYQIEGTKHILAQYLAAS